MRYNTAESGAFRSAHGLSASRLNHVSESAVMKRKSERPNSSPVALSAGSRYAL